MKAGFKTRASGASLSSDDFQNLSALRNIVLSTKQEEDVDKSFDEFENKCLGLGRIGGPWREVVCHLNRIRFTDSRLGVQSLAPSSSVTITSTSASFTVKLRKSGLSKFK